MKGKGILFSYKAGDMINVEAIAVAILKKYFVENDKIFREPATYHII